MGKEGIWVGNRGGIGFGDGGGFACYGQRSIVRRTSNMEFVLLVQVGKRRGQNAILFFQEVVGSKMGWGGEGGFVVVGWY